MLAKLGPPVGVGVEGAGDRARREAVMRIACS